MPILRLIINPLPLFSSIYDRQGVPYQSVVLSRINLSFFLSSEDVSFKVSFIPRSSVASEILAITVLREDSYQDNESIGRRP